MRFCKTTSSEVISIQPKPSSSDAVQPSVTTTPQQKKNGQIHPTKSDGMNGLTRLSSDSKQQHSGAPLSPEERLQP
jgi:hypothetical protein